MLIFLIIIIKNKECFPATLIIPNQAINFSYPNKIDYIKNITIDTIIIYNCSVPLTNISTWTLEEIDPLTNEVLQYINITSNPTANQSNLRVKNGSLKYGLYKFTFNFTIITNDETAAPFISIIYDYIKVVPTGFIVSGFDIAFGDMPITSLNVGPTDTIAFIPAFFSYDSDALSDPKILDYQFYCYLADIDIDLNSNETLNFTNSIYWINPNADLTNEQLNAEGSCIKSAPDQCNQF